jgi:hypothetical protein
VVVEVHGFHPRRYLTENLADFLGILKENFFLQWKRSSGQAKTQD